MDHFRSFVFYLILINLKLWAVVASATPIVSYCHTDSADQLTAGQCNMTYVSNSTFEFGNINQNVLQLTDTSTFKLVLLKCEAHYPVHWLAFKPLGAIEYVSNAEVNRFDHDPVNVRDAVYSQYLSIEVGTQFSRKLRCEGFSDTTLAAEVFINSPDPGFPLWRVATGGSNNYAVNIKEGNAGNHILPCVAQQFHRNYSLAVIRTHIDAPPTGEISENCATCICRASSDCTSFPCNSSRVCGEIPKLYWSRSSPSRFSDCRGDFPCIRDIIVDYMKKELTQTDCDGDGLISCRDYGQIHSQRNRGQCEGDFADSTVALDSADFANCLIKAQENFTILPRQPGDYDPRIGLRISNKPDWWSHYECIFDSETTYQIYSLYPSRSASAHLSYVAESAKFHCVPAQESLQLGHPDMLFGKCKSLTDCELKFAPMQPAVFTDVDAVPEGKYDRIRFDNDLPNNGFTSDYNHGFVQCYGTYFRPPYLLSQTDYFFTGLDNKRYLISSDFPVTSVISIAERNETSYHFYTCKISTFVLLPNVVFAVDYRTGEQQLFKLGKPQDSAVVKAIQQDEDNATATWELQLVITERMTKVTCYAPWIISPDWARAEFILGGIDAPDSGSYVAFYITGGTLLGLAVLLAAVLFFVRKAFVVLKSKSQNRNEGGAFYFEEGDVTIGGKTEVLKILEEKIIRSSQLITEDIVLGEGQFGIVRKGTLTHKPVAVKSCKSNADFEYFKAFVKELEMLSFIGEHDNIVRFHGAVVERMHEREVQAVFEISNIGNLNYYLRTKTTQREQNAISQSILISFCKQIASGMEFLSNKEVIHGDLAARNVLIFENNVVKVTDFGLSRKLYNYSIYTKKNKAPLPWRWMALESMRFLEFSTKSDVWSFGVTVWEIFSMARVPYSGHTYTDEFVNRIESGFRLLQPDLAPDPVFNWMKKCWKNIADDRPTFLECKAFFTNLESSANVADGMYGVVTGQLCTDGSLPGQKSYSGPLLLPESFKSS